MLKPYDIHCGLLTGLITLNKGFLILVWDHLNTITIFETIVYSNVFDK